MSAHCDNCEADLAYRPGMEGMYCPRCEASERAVSLEMRVAELEAALAAAVYHAENLARVRNHISVRDLDESHLAFVKAKQVLMKEDDHA